jgi:hypothetical protein
VMFRRGNLKRGMAEHDLRVQAVETQSKRYAQE